MSLRKNASIATLAVMGSRVMGLVREMVFAFFFGAGPALDAFIAAFRIPNLLRDLFAEGALSSSFVAIFSKKLATEGDEEAFKLASRVFSFVWILMAVISLLGIIFSPQIVHVVASGFTGEKFELTVLLNRILFPFILFVSLAAIAMGMLNAKGKFALPQSASTFFNITSIVTGLLTAYFLAPEFIGGVARHLIYKTPAPAGDWVSLSRAMMGMAIGSLLGGLVQWIVQMPALFRLGYRPHFLMGWTDPAFKQVIRLTIPAIIGGAAVQVNVLVNTNFASYLADGSISWLNYAFRLMQFPIGVFGVAVASATTPVLARFLALNDLESFRKTLRESSQLAMFLCIPSALGLMALARPIMALIYEHGQFTAQDTTQAAYALMAYSTGLVAYALVKIYQPAFLAFNDSRTPMLISLGSIVTNLILNGVFVFVFHFHHWGLALGTSLVALANAALLSILFRERLPKIWNRDLVVQLTKILAASILAVGLGFWLESQITLGKFLQVFAPLGVTVLVYAGICHLIGVQEMGLAATAFKRKFRR